MKACLWIARLVGLGIVGLVTALAVGQRFNPLALGGAELAMIAALIVALTGMLLLWRWMGAGGTLVVVGMTAFYALNFAASGRLPGGWVFPLCFVPGVLGMICWMVSRRGQRQTAASKASTMTR
jgi:hypothetical protein